jgi:hypothetical protein
MALVKVRATSLCFNGGPNPDIRKGVWNFAGDRKHFVNKEDRGLKQPGEEFMIEESKFSAECMEYVDPPMPPVAKEVSAQVDAIMTDAPRRGRPKKSV